MFTAIETISTTIFINHNYLCDNSMPMFKNYLALNFQ